MRPDTLVKLALALALLALAAVFLWRYAKANRSAADTAFFYDLSQQKLFVGPRTAIPPIRGIDGPEEDGVRAVVISTNGTPEDKASRTIAYLEMYSPELKRQMEEAQRTGTSPEMGRALAQAHRFVRRLADKEWFPLNSPEGERIVTEWARPGPNGMTPVVCGP